MFHWTVYHLHSVVWSFVSRFICRYPFPEIRVFRFLFFFYSYCHTCSKLEQSFKDVLNFFFNSLQTMSPLFVGIPLHPHSPTLHLCACAHTHTHIWYATAAIHGSDYIAIWLAERTWKLWAITTYPLCGLVVLELGSFSFLPLLLKLHHFLCEKNK